MEHAFPQHIMYNIVRHKYTHPHTDVCVISFTVYLDALWHESTISYITEYTLFHSTYTDDDVNE